MRHVSRKSPDPILKSAKDPALTNKVNITGTLSTLFPAMDGGARKLVFASSAAVYGFPDTFPVREDFLPRSESLCAVTKILGEEYCRLFDEFYGLKTVSLRYFNFYGPRQGRPEDEGVRRVHALLT